MSQLRLTPEDSFPEDLSVLSDPVLQVLDSQVQRQLDREYIVEGEPDPETEFRHWDIDEEFEHREGTESEAVS
ncbi:hypothetical protein IV498_10710 [Paenarthrobacter sp. Z7-10]|uniref:hypothetical protein n=1 Tax=Paenarthrobacter sp. Z7-10 TaxID=2787635 RepID=UPI0022A9C0E0|nr:hypothetical protein [Paenarthrobacter sp. Z7-10]MCZ2403640.1 hypothetical protein [Paenarthrobacter sp. Z7-10]